MRTDVLIVGGGLVGLSLGLALAKAGVSTTVVDREDPKVAKEDAFDGRASAIARGSQQMLAGIGLWPAVAEDAAPITDIRVSDGAIQPRGMAGRASSLFLHYDCKELDGRPLGYIVENRHLRRALMAAASKTSGLTYLAPSALRDLQRHTGGVQAQTATDSIIDASLAVAADGRQSSLRQAAGIGLESWNYPQCGIVATIWHEKSHDGVAHEHFLPAGPFALLPLTDAPSQGPEGMSHRSSLVWTEQRALTASMMALDDRAFSDELMRRFGNSLGQLTVAGRRWSYPLSLQHAHRYKDNRLALVGDAAHVIHPIAGQGLNLGLRDVAALAEVIVDARRLGLDVGSPEILDHYERWRRLDNTALMLATDGLNRLFSNDLRPLRLARDLGLAAINNAPPLKRLFMRHAMGMVGDLPRLVKGEAL
ncbi:MAG: UbiH/UbiF/VisC/COQ6 family ubiquinone biosynthesis hydroxylase [Pseudomonadota bacterium]